MYKAKKMRFKNAIEVHEYHDAKYGAPGQKRQKKKKATPEQIARQNQKNRERLARWKLREYFNVNDYFTTLTYRKDERPESMEACRKDLQKFLRKIRKLYKAAGKEMRYMLNIEVGTRGAWHAHIVLKRVPDLDVAMAKAWGHGKVVNQLLYEKGEFRELAAYITKSPVNDKKLKDAKYSCSKNMPLKEPEKKVYRKWKTWGKVRVPKGWYLDKDSVVEGINLWGFPYREYTLLRIQRKE